MSILLRSLSPGAFIPDCKSQKVFLRMPKLSDYSDWASLRSDSRSFLEPWEPKWSPSALTKANFKKRLRRYAKEVKDDKSIAFFIFCRKNTEIVGAISLSNIRRGVTQSCSLGYWIGEKYARQGFMSEAVLVTINYVFDSLNLHRLEAACVPNNYASLGVLRKTGFSEEGFARKYLQINGVWQDHILFAILSSDIRKSKKV